MIEYARGQSELDYDSAAAGREFLVDVASSLERTRCLTDLVPRIDRALRLMPLPDPETYYPEEPEPDSYDYEQDYGR